MPDTVTMGVITVEILGARGPQGPAGSGGGSGSFTAGGDLTGTDTVQVVAKVKGAAVGTTAGALTTGQPLRVTGTSTIDYGPLDLANASAVTGTLPGANVQVVSGSNQGVITAAYKSQLDTLISGGGFTAAGDLTGNATSQTVAKVNGVTYPAGPLTIFQIPIASASGAVTYGFVDLSTASVTGILPAGKQAAQTLTGDVAGTTAANTLTLAGDVSGRAGTTVVGKVNGVVYPTATLTTGQVPRATGAGTVAYGAVDLANSAAVTGTLPTGNQAAQALAGDVVGTTAANTCTLAGDITGRTGITVCAKVNGTTYPAGGALTTGTIPRVTGVATVAYGALDLANASAVTGVLPTANQASQTIAGDVTGTTAASVVAKVNGATYPAAGALTTGTIPRVTGVSTVAYGPLDLANASAVTGLLPSANQGAQTITGDVTGNTGASVVAKVNGVTITGTPSATNVLTATSSSAATWSAPAGGTPSGAAGGDLSSTYPNPTVAKINGATIPAAGALTTGHVPSVSGASALTYGFVANANVDAAAAIAGTKIAPSFGSQNIVTTGVISLGTNPASGVSPTQICCAYNAAKSAVVAVRNSGNTSDIPLLATGPFDTYVNGYNDSSSAVNLQLCAAGGAYVYATIGATLIARFGAGNVLEFVANANSSVSQLDSTAASATGKTLTVRAQGCTGTTSTGGDLILSGGAGTSANGKVGIANVATTTSAPAAGGASALPATPAGFVTILINGVSRQLPYY